jgi:hypothetical protein
MAVKLPESEVAPIAEPEIESADENEEEVVTPDASDAGTSAAADAQS